MDAQSVPPHIKQLVRDQLNSSVPTFEFDGARTTKVQPTIMRKTIMEHLFGLKEVALLRTTKKPEEISWDLWKASLEYALGMGIQDGGRSYTIIGGSSSLKKGVFWLGTEKMKAMTRKYFRSAQEALTYLGVFISSNHYGIFDLELKIVVVEDRELDTGDGMGWITSQLLNKIGLPHRQAQVRLIADSWLGKGTLHTVPEMSSFPACDVILPHSMIKGAGKPSPGPQRVTLGIRDVGQRRAYSSNFTFAEWFSQNILEQLYPVMDGKLKRTHDALCDGRSALDFLHMLPENPDDPINPDARSKLEAFLQAGLSPTHPWMNRHLRELMRRQYVTLALGGGIELEGFMGAHADLDEGNICVPELPEGPMVLSRYPIRDPHSLQAVWNHPHAVGYALPGSVYLSGALAEKLDGDFDGDFYTVNTQQRVVDAVWSSDWGRRFERIGHHEKARRCDALDTLPYVAVESLGNSIGHITYLITASVLSNRTEYVAQLSASLQDEVQSLKWSTRADQEFLRQVEQSVSIPEFLSAAKNDRDLFVKYANPVEGDHPLISNHNYVAQEWRSTDDIQEPLIKFKPEIPLWVVPSSLDCVEESSVVVSVYNRWCSRIIAEMQGKPTTEDLAAPVQFLESWGQTKDKRQAWAVALWSVVHGTRSDNCGSAVFHAFPEDTIELLRLKSDAPAVTLPKRSSPSNQGEVWTIPIVGGHYYLTGNPDPKTAFKQMLAGISRCTVRTTRSGEQVLFEAEGIILGTVPKSSLLFGAIPPDLQFEAQVILRASTVWLVTTRLF